MWSGLMIYFYILKMVSIILCGQHGMCVCVTYLGKKWHVMDYEKKASQQR